MMTKIYLAVRIYATFHLLYELWVFLFCRKMYGLWDRLYRWSRIIRMKMWHWRKKRTAARLERRKRHDMRNKRKKKEKPTAVPTAGCEVIGKTKSVYIPDPKKAKEPVRSEPLPESDFICEDGEISADDVDDILTGNDDISTELTESEMQELMAPGDIEPDPDFPTGIPIDRISDAADILLSGTDDIGKRMIAAETLFQLKDTDLFDLFAENISSQEEMDLIIAECLTEKGERKNITEEEPDMHQEVNWDEYM